MTFDVMAGVNAGSSYQWQAHIELFSVCRRCSRPTIFHVSQKEIRATGTPLPAESLMQYPKALNDVVKINGPVLIRDAANHQSPELLSEELANAYNEAATCLSVGCYNAAGAMFRLCLDIVTRPLLPDPVDSSVDQPNSKQRRDLGLRLSWLFEKGRLDPALRELAQCIREDGNDGAHAGNLSLEDAEDIKDFTLALLDKLVIQPKKLQQAEARRIARRSSRQGGE